MKNKLLTLAILSLLFLSCSTNDDLNQTEEHLTIQNESSKRQSSNPFDCPTGDFSYYEITYTDPYITETEKQAIRDQYFAEFSLLYGYCKEPFSMNNEEIWFGSKNLPSVKPSINTNGDPDVDARLPK